MAHLLEFEQRVPTCQVPPWLQQVTGPLVLQEWRRDLASHPDQQFKEYITAGIARGFRIGFDYKRVSCKPALTNLYSAEENSEVVQAYLDKEVAMQRVVGPVPPVQLPPGTQVSPFGVIPKSGQPGRWRLIVDLSHPEGRSVNSGIEADLCSMHYLRLDEVTQRIMEMGKGTEMAKMDIESAYRMVPIFPGDRLLLAMRWKGQFFFDTRLPFGLRSAPKIFSAVADALQWSLVQAGVTWVAHYLDDFITLGRKESKECGSNLDCILATCRRLGVPVARAKCEGPTTSLVFLGFLIDSTQMTVSLPEPKLQRTLRLVAEWSGRKAGRKRELESLLGHLQHAATVVRPGRSFVRRLIELLSSVVGHDRWVRLNASARSDLMWWQSFMGQWNGVSLIPNQQLEATVETDASGSWGCGGRWGGKWFQWKWEGPSSEWLIASKELLPILFAVAIWGKNWRGQRVNCRCDNMAVVAVINAGRAKDRSLMHLLRCLFFWTAHYSIHLRASHVPGVSNVAADALSRNDFSRFLQVVPEAEPNPESIPEQLVVLLAKEQPDWVSPRWTQLFRDCCRLV